METSYSNGHERTTVIHNMGESNKDDEEMKPHDSIFKSNQN